MQLDPAVLPQAAGDLQLLEQLVAAAPFAAASALSTEAMAWQPPAAMPLGSWSPPQTQTSAPHHAGAFQQPAPQQPHFQFQQQPQQPAGEELSAALNGLIALAYERVAAASASLAAVTSSMQTVNAPVQDQRPMPWQQAWQQHAGAAGLFADGSQQLQQPLQLPHMAQDVVLRGGSDGGSSSGGNSPTGRLRPASQQLHHGGFGGGSFGSPLLGGLPPGSIGAAPASDSNSFSSLLDLYSMSHSSSAAADGALLLAAPPAAPGPGGSASYAATSQPLLSLAAAAAAAGIGQAAGGVDSGASSSRLARGCSSRLCSSGLGGSGAWASGSFSSTASIVRGLQTGGSSSSSGSLARVDSQQGLLQAACGWEGGVAQHVPADVVVQPYCRQELTPELDEAVVALLSQLRHLQYNRGSLVSGTS